jgi:hypothetical protein
MQIFEEDDMCMRIEVGWNPSAIGPYSSPEIQLYHK